VVPPFPHLATASFLAASPEQVEASIRAAVRGARAMRAMPIHRRVALVERLAELVARDVERLAASETWSTGKPIKETTREAQRTGDTLRLAARAADLLQGRQVLTDTTPAGSPVWGFTHRRPIGIVAAIAPSNAPLNLLAHKLGPALIAGNAVIAKPAPQTTLTGLQLVELAHEAGVPLEACQILVGDAEPALALAADARVGAITFTGGPTAGRALWSAAPFKRVIMELGGNSANLVLADADLEHAARELARGGYSNSGQSCNSVQRIIVEDAVAERLVTLLEREVAKLRVGDPFDPDTDVAGMASATAAERVRSAVTDAVAAGAVRRHGGTSEGTRIEPVLLDHVRPEMAVAAQEIFGPVVGVIRVRDVAHAVEVANSTGYGLQFALFTSSVDTVLDLSEQLESGSLIVNRSSNFRLDSFPYGGIKGSGVGREDPASSVLQLSEEHFVVLGDRRVPQPHED
jgi:glyceraldehyde-3-phosphate dehydrogenase (NADP+)